MGGNRPEQCVQKCYITQLEGMKSYINTSVKLKGKGLEQSPLYFYTINAPFIKYLLWAKPSAKMLLIHYISLNPDKSPVGWYNHFCFVGESGLIAFILQRKKRRFGVMKRH